MENKELEGILEWIRGTCTMANVKVTTRGAQRSRIRSTSEGRHRTWAEGA